MTSDLNPIDLYAMSRDTVHRAVFDGFGLTLDRSSRSDGAPDDAPVATVMVEPMARHFAMVDLEGTDFRIMQVGGMRIEGPSPSGGVCFVPAGHGADYGWKCSRANRACFELDIEPETMFELVPELFNRRFSIERLVDVRFRESVDLALLGHLMRREAEGTAPRDSLLRQSLLRSFLLSLAGHLEHDFELPGFRMDRRLQRAIDFIEAEFTREISLDEICRAAGCSSSHLTDMFRRTLNCTPYSYVIDRRLSEAMRRLANADEPLATLALDCGFADQQHMTRLFRARLGSTPGAYRRGAANHRAYHEMG